MINQIPNALTCLNLLCGCFSIVFIFKGEIEVSALLTSGSLVFDFLDGFAARAMKASSTIGKELDSLADVVSFGVAPACIVYQFLRLALANDVNALATSSWLFAPAFLIPMAGAYRLARFNLDTTQSTYFKGVPIPMIGILTAVFPLIYWQPSFGIISKLLLSPIFWYGYILVVSYLMVMTRPMLALKSLSNKKKLILPLGIVVVEVVISALFFKWYAIPFGFIGYCIVSLMYPKTITQ